jgi:hypothetical protein
VQLARDAAPLLLLRRDETPQQLRAGGLGLPVLGDLGLERHVDVGQFRRPLPDLDLQLVVRLAEVALGPPAFGVGAMECLRVAADEDAEGDDARRHAERHREGRVVEAGARAPDDEAAEHDRDEDGRRQEVARHVAAGRVAHDDRREPPVRAREQDAEAEQDERQRRVQGHPRVGGDAVEERDFVEVADEGEERDE